MLVHAQHEGRAHTQSVASHLREHVILSMPQDVVAAVLQQLEVVGLIFLHEMILGAVAQNMHVSPGDDGTAAWCTLRMQYVCLLEQCALLCEGVKVWCLHKRVAICSNALGPGL